MLARSLKKLKFFASLNQQIWPELLKHSSYCWVQKNTTIFEGKSIVDCFYIVISGVVSYSQQKFDFYIKTGESFGEVIVLGKDIILLIALDDPELHTISKFTYKAEEDCQLIRIEWKKFKEIALNPPIDVFVRRTILVKSCDYLKHIDPYGSTILSLLGNIQTYGYGEVILKQGTKPSSFNIVMLGQCKTIFEKIVSRSQDLRENSTKKNFSFGVKKDKLEITKDIKKVKNVENEKEIVMPSGRSFENQKIKAIYINSQPDLLKILYRGHVN